MFGEWGSSSSLTIAACFLMLAHQFYNHKWEKSIEFLFISRKQRNGLFSLTDKRADKKTQFSLLLKFKCFKSLGLSTDQAICRLHAMSVCGLLTANVLCYACRKFKIVLRVWKLHNCGRYLLSYYLRRVTFGFNKKKIIVSRNSKKRRGRHWLTILSIALSMFLLDGRSNLSGYNEKFHSCSSTTVESASPLQLSFSFEFNRFKTLQWIAMDYCFRKKIEIYLCKCHKECLILGHV